MLVERKKEQQCVEGESDLIPASFPEGEAWYVVYTNPQCETRANLGLRSKGYETFLPMMKRWVTHARRRFIGHRPLFPRYLFIRMDINKQGMLGVRRTDGVERVLTNHNVPVRVSDGAIDALISNQQLGAFDLTKPDIELEEGDEVKIVEGPLIGYTAAFNRVVQKMDQLRNGTPTTRVEILLQMFARPTKITFDIENVRKI